MEKRKSIILVIDRPLKQGEHSEDIFNVYREKGYDIVIFPWKSDKTRTEVIVFSYCIFSNIKYLFHLPYVYDEDETLYDFNLEGIDEQKFYDILNQKFEVATFNLTAVERKQVDETTSTEEFSEFIDRAFIAMCRSRNKTKHKVEYDDEKQELIFHYIDGTADKVQITNIEGYKPKEIFIEISG